MARNGPLLQLLWFSLSIYNVKKTLLHSRPLDHSLHGGDFTACIYTEFYKRSFGNISDSLCTCNICPISPTVAGIYVSQNSVLMQTWAKLHTCRFKLVATGWRCSTCPVHSLSATAHQHFTNTCTAKDPERQTRESNKPSFPQSQLALGLIIRWRVGNFSAVWQIQAPAGKQCRRWRVQHGECQLYEEHSWLSHTLPPEELNHRCCYYM